MAKWIFDEPKKTAAARFEGWSARRQTTYPHVKNYASACIFALSSVVVLLQGAA